MALGKSNRVDGKAFSLKLATKRAGVFLPRSEWEIQIKQADGTYKTLSNEEMESVIGVKGPLYDVEGDLIGLEARQGEYDGNPIYNITLNLRDSKRNEIYFTGYTIGSILGRKLSNSILNLQAFDSVQVGLYNQTNPETKKVYGAASLRQGGNTATIKGKYDFKTDERLQPRLFEGKGGKTEKDWTKVDLFLFQELQAFGASLRPKANQGQASEQSSEPAKEPANEAPAQEVSEDDPPF